MLARLIQPRGLLGVNFVSSYAKRCFSNEYSPFIPGGGLDKLQGGFNEESYFKINDYKLLLKVREQALCEDGYNTSSLKRVIDAVDREVESLKAAHRLHGLMNKNKICAEELFFLTEEAENLRRLERKMRLKLEEKMQKELNAAEYDVKKWKS